MIHQVVSEIWVFRMGSTILEHPVQTLKIMPVTKVEILHIFMYLEIKLSLLHVASLKIRKQKFRNPLGKNSII